jgi:hypothetical protein
MASSGNDLVFQGLMRLRPFLKRLSLRQSVARWVRFGPGGVFGPVLLETGAYPEVFSGGFRIALNEPNILNA